MEEQLPEFGTKRENEERRDGGLGVIFDPETQLYAVGNQPSGLLALFAGGVDPKDDIQEGVLREVREESGLYDFLYVEKLGAGYAHYRNSLRNVNRFTKSTAFLIVLKSRSLQATKLEAHEQFTLAWATPEELLANWNVRNENKDHDHSIYFLERAVSRVKELGHDKKATL